MVKKINVLFIYIGILLVMLSCSSPEAQPDEKIAEEGIRVRKPPKGCDVIDSIDEFNESTGDQSYNMDIDADRNFNKTATGVTDAGETLYAVCDGDWFIYCDKKTGNSGLLCGNPECDHTNKECNAYMKDCWGTQYYEGYLYTVQDIDGFKLKKVSTDGTEREDLGKLTATDVIISRDTGGCSIDWIIHRGYIYYLYNWDAGWTEDIYYLNNSNCIYRRSLEKDSKPECITALPVLSWWAECRLIGEGSYIYILMPTADQETDCYLYRYNIETEKLEWFKEWGNNICGVAVHDNKIYYLERDRAAKKFKMYCYNLETKEKNILFETKGISAGMSHDDDYIYIANMLEDETWRREVWNWDGRYLTDIEINPTRRFDDEGRRRGLAGSDNERIYISCISGNEEIYGIHIMGYALVIEYIEKEDILDGEYEIKEWSEMADNR